MRSGMGRLTVPVAVLLVAMLAGCIQGDVDEDDAGQDDGDDPGYTQFPPPQEVGGFHLLADLKLGNVNELTLREDFAYLSGNSGAFIVDISDPGAPVVTAELQCTGIHVRTIDLGDQLLMTLSSQADDNCDGANQAGGLRLIDVTDPLAPVVGPQLALEFGSHTHTQYNDTGIVYNSAYNLPTRFTEHESLEQHRRVEIIDVSDWQDPKVVEEFMFPPDSVSLGCHDIWPEPHRDRAVCAAIDETQIWDLSDPMAPKIVSTIHNPLISIHHSATTTADGDTLILGDEFTGALGPGCYDGGTAPIGALWFYDISDETDPQLQGYFAPPHQGPDIPCTAHNFNVVEGHDVLVAGFFKAGTALVDFSDPSAPTLIDRVQPPETDVWAGYYHNGHVYTGDRGRGMDVFMFTGDNAGHDHELRLKPLPPNAS